MIGSLQQFTKKNSYKGQFLCSSVHFIKLVRQSKNVFNAMLIQNIIKQKINIKLLKFKGYSKFGARFRQLLGTDWL